jgi:hypothetical protein
MRSHKAVVFDFLGICTKRGRCGANPYYALPTRLGTFSKSLDGPQDYLPTQIPMRVDMYRKLKKLYMKKVGIRRPPQTH